MPSSSLLGSMPCGVADGLHTRALRCFDTKVSDISFFLQVPGSVLLAAPLDLQRQQDKIWERSVAWKEGRLDLDFVLYDGTLTSTDAATATAADKNPKVDYGFLSAQPMPPRRPGESVNERAVVLQDWIRRCYELSASVNIGERLKKVSSRLAFEYESYLCSLKLPDDSRSVRGLVAPGTSGQLHHSTVALIIPLLLSQQSTIVSSLNNILTLYAKFTGLVFRKTQYIASMLVDLCIQLDVSGPPQDERLTVRSERLSVHVEDSSASGEEPSKLLLQSLIDLRSLPQFSTTLQRGDGFMDYVPKLEAALLHNLRHPFHFLSLVLGLSATFGCPVDLCPAATTMDPSAQGSSSLPLVRTAVFCIVDKKTSISFMIGLHYYSGLELPSVGVVANQYFSTAMHGAPLRAKVKYPDHTAESLSVDKDGFLQVQELSRVVTEGTMEALSKLLASFS